MISREQKIYWNTQVVVWCVFAVVRCAAYLTLTPPPHQGRMVLRYFCESALGLLLTHGFRVVFHRLRWTQLSIRAVLPRAFAVVACAALIWLGFFVLMTTAIFDRTPLREIPLPLVLYSYWQLLICLLAWTASYLSLHWAFQYERMRFEQASLSASMKETELRALRSQLNPHFLFNSLNNIRALIVDDPPRAQSMVTEMANILRYSLHSSRSATVPLEDEMRIVRGYLELESIRLEERLRLEFEIDSSTLRFAVPPMIIQTLVENGIKHGIASRPAGGELLIRTFVQDQSLHVMVCSSGTLAEEQSGVGLGIANSRSRLQYLFGPSASLSLRNSAPDTVTAEVIIPCTETV